MRAPEVCDELTGGNALCKAVVDHGIVQSTGADAAVIFRVSSRDAAVDRRIIGGASLRHLRLRCCGDVRGRLDLRMVLKRDLLGLAHSESLSSLSQSRSGRQRCYGQK